MQILIACIAIAKARKLYCFPLPKYDLLMLAFVSLEKANEASSAIFRAGFKPGTLALVLNYHYKKLL